METKQIEDTLKPTQFSTRTIDISHLLSLRAPTWYQQSYLQIFYDDDTPQFQYCKFQQKTKEALNRCKNPTKKNKEQIWKPKPKNPYCHICKKSYNDYLEHIKDNRHIGKIRKNHVNLYISELAKIYQHKRTNPQDLS